MPKKLVFWTFMIIVLPCLLVSCQKTSESGKLADESKPNPYPASGSKEGNYPTAVVTMPPYPIEEGSEISSTTIPDVVVPTPGADSGVVTGKMLYTDTGKPVPGHVIYLGFKIYLTPGPDYTYGITQSGSPQTNTDSEGNFAFGDVPPGSYIILLWSLTGASVAKEPGSAQELEINVKPGEVLELGTIEVNSFDAK